MTLTAILIVSAALFGIGLFGALSQKSFVLLMMGLEMMLNGTLLAAVMSKSGQIPLHIWLPDAMAGPTPVAVYRKRQADVIEALGTPKQ
jgi:NAD(P)H-quinone oxidoreductase subunit 4L